MPVYLPHYPSEIAHVAWLAAWILSLAAYATVALAAIWTAVGRRGGPR